MIRKTWWLVQLGLMRGWADLCVRGIQLIMRQNSLCWKITRRLLPEEVSHVLCRRQRNPDPTCRSPFQHAFCNRHTLAADAVHSRCSPCILQNLDRPIQARVTHFQSHVLKGKDTFQMPARLGLEIVAILDSCLGTTSYQHHESGSGIELDLELTHESQKLELDVCSCRPQECTVCEVGLLFFWLTLVIAIGRWNGRA